MEPVPKAWVSESCCRRFLVVLSAVAIFALCLAAKDFVRPATRPAKTYPAHDDHPDEKVAIAADPYDTADKAKIFSVNFHEHGFLPIFFVVTNDGNQPISIANLQVTLITANRDKLTPRSPEDIYRRLTNPRTNTNAPLPFPIPQKKVKGTISQKERDEIESSQFAAKAVEPHTHAIGIPFLRCGRRHRAPRRRAHLRERRQRCQRHRADVLRTSAGEIPEPTEEGKLTQV